MPSFPPAWLPPSLVLPAELAKLVLLAVLLAGLMARSGIACLAVLGSRRPRSPLARFGAGFLAGLTPYGLAVLGLALTGLLYPGTILAALAAMSLPRRGDRAPRPARAEAGAPRPGRLTTAMQVLACVPAVLLVLPPVREVDAYAYHLASVWQFLRVHRILLDHVRLGFQYPLPVEMASIPAIVLGDDRLVSCIALTCFCSATAVFLATARRETAWLAPWLAMAGGGLLPLVASGKSDLPASASFVVGALLLDAGDRRAGAWLLGTCAAAKPAYIPLVICWWLVGRPPRRRLLDPTAWILFVPSAPWIAKSLLANGNPFYPLGGDAIATFGWDWRNGAAFRDYVRPLWLAHTGTWDAIPLAWFRAMADTYPLLLAAIPGLLAFSGRHRRGVAACILAQLVILRMGHLARYWIPSIWLLAFFTAEGIAELAAGRRRLLTTLLAAYSVAAVAVSPSVTGIPWRDAVRPYARSLEEQLGLYGDACRRLAGSGESRVLVIGEQCTYQLPVRAIYGGMIGETPFVWKAVSESRSERDVAVKFRQAGVGAVLYNYISAYYRVVSIGTWFPWDARMGRVYEAFCRTRLAPPLGTERCDYVNGGYYLYKVRGRPAAAAAPAPGRIFYLPGAEALGGRAHEMQIASRHAEAARLFQALSVAYPSVLVFRCDMADDLAALYRWREVRDSLAPAMAAGMMHWAIPRMGLALFNLGDYAGARAAFRACLGRYPRDAYAIRFGIASACAEEAQTHGRASANREAERLLVEAELALRDGATGAPAFPDPAWVNLLRAVRISMAELYSREGRTAEAAGCRQEAARLVPGHASPGAADVRNPGGTGPPAP